MSEFNKYRLKGAYHYDWYETEDWYRWLVDRCAKFAKGDTLDIGCGDGLLCRKIIDAGNKVTGIDPDAYGINLANDLVPEADLLVLDAAGILSGKWEYLVCMNVIEHMNRPEDIKDLINKHITKGAIITTIDYQGGSFGYDHKFEWTYDEMIDFFKEFKPKGFRYKDTEWIGVEITK